MYTILCIGYTTAELEVSYKKVVPVETNIVIFELAEREKEAKFLNHFAGKGIRLSGMGSGKLRMVTHLDYSDSMHDYFITVLRSARL